MSAGQLFLGAVRGFLRLTRLELQIQKQAGDVAAGVRLGMIFEERDRLTFLAAGRERFRFQQQRGAVGRIHFNRALDKLFRFVVLAAIEQALGVTQIGLRCFPSSAMAMPTPLRSPGPAALSRLQLLGFGRVRDGREFCCPTDGIA